MLRRITFTASIFIAVFVLSISGNSQTWQELFQQARSLQGSKKLDSAIIIGNQALEGVMAELGPDDIEAARIMRWLGMFCYADVGDLTKAEEMVLGTMDIQIKIRGPQGNHVCHRWYDLGMLYWNLGRYEECVTILSRSAEMYDMREAEDSSIVSSIINLKALAYEKMARYVEAESAARQALAIRQRIVDTTGTLVGKSLKNLGMICIGQGQYDAAESYFRESLAIKEKVLGPNHWLVGTSLDGLAAVCEIQNKLEEAEQLRSRAVGNITLKWGPDSKKLSPLLSNLAQVYFLQGKYEEAESVFNEAIRIYADSSGREHPNMSGILTRLAVCLQAQGKYAEAGKFHNRALSIAEKSFGRQNLNVAKCLTGLAELYRLQKLQDKALATTKRAGDIWRKNFIENSMFLSELDALSYSPFFRNSVDHYFSCLVDLETLEPGEIVDAANAVISSKGQVSDGIFKMNRAIISETDSATVKLARAFKAAKFKLSNHFVRGPGANMDEFRQKANLLTIVANELEEELAHASASFRDRKDLSNITADQIQSLLPDNSTLIEYFKYDYLECGTDNFTPHYLVLIVNNDGKPVVNDLGDASRLDRLITRYREHLIGLSSKPHQPLQKDKDEYTEIASGLYNILIHPLREHLSGKDLVLVAPDGGLNLVSFAGLIDDNGQYLIESFPIHYLSSGRELIRLQNQSKQGSGLLAIGDPDYDADVAQRLQSASDFQHAVAEGATYGPRNYRSGCDYFSSTRLSQLPGTRMEIDTVTSIWLNTSDEPVSAHMGYQASEDIFKSEAPGKKVIHLATHGYYMTDQCRATLPTGWAGIIENSVGENPLLQSGLFFAGANLQGSGADSAGIEDGILTAYEVSALDLRGAQMVVLSACETGLGQVRQGEGVYGLRRAFQIAGVRTIVSALWPISDKDTAPLISGLYDDDDDMLPQRLRKIQMERIAQLRSMELADHPYNWGAFIALGDWR